MTETTVRSVLRLLAVITVLVGAVLATTTLVSLLGVSSAMRSVGPGMQVEVTGMAGRMGAFALLAHALVALWGLVLWGYSTTLARWIVD